MNYSEEENPLTLKSDFILSMCELIVGGKDGLQPVEKTIIDRSVRKVYQDYLADPVPEKMPILEDLYNILRSQDVYKRQLLHKPHHPYQRRGYAAAGGQVAFPQAGQRPH